MSQETAQHTGAWVVFNQASFVASAALVGFGIRFMPLDFWMKGYLAMGTVMLIQSCITATKTLRDVHEGRRMVNRIEDARTERLLMSVGKE
ncbi:YiaA/YiaB family inner membrane protein [Methylorubrum aminovorans]|uniref:YiaA/YiaB family inner membrane protein n=1 Tax=Methylorubrum aminovorans TaxID=269069 RepID=UPI003C2DB479